MALTAASATIAETGRTVDGLEDGERNPDQQQEMALDIALVQSLGEALCDKRKEAMDYRTNLGIESDWQEDEEYYQSIDAANPEGETNVGKPISNDGGPVGVMDSASQQKTPTRSSVFIPLTRPYVDAAAARIADMLLPNDDMPWTLKPTPISDEEQALQRVKEAMGGELAGPEGMQSATSQAAATVATQALGPNMTGSMTGGMMGGPAAAAPAGEGGMMGSPAPTPVQVPPTATGMAAVKSAGLPNNAAQAVMGNPAAMAHMAGAASEDDDPAAAAKSPQERAADLATQQITDWLIECQYHAEFRKMLENAAKLGTGVLKGPIPELKVSQRVVWAQDENGKRVAKVERIYTTVPVSRSVDPRNFFPDPACGEDVQRGGYTWEYDTLSARQIEEFLHDEAYIEPQLRKVLREGPQKPGATLAERPENSPNINTSETQLIGQAFGVWYFHGMVERSLLLACGVPAEDFETLDEPDAESVSAIITVINDTVVKASLSSLDQGGFPYDVMPWQRRAGMIWGMGVARQMRTPQRMVNGAARALMDNMGFSSGPIWAIRKPWIKSLDGDNVLRPRKGFEMTAEAPDTAKIQDAISFTDVPSMQAELEAIIQLGMKMAEDATGLPMLLQGQQGGAPDTVGGMQILNNNGSTVLRRIARQADDYVTERHIRRYYYWLLENTDNDKAKGDFQIDARGSTALVDRELSNQHLLAMVPQLRSDPDVHQTRLNQEILKAFRIDWKPIYKTAAEKKASPPPPPPESVLVANIREENANKRKAAEIQSKERIEAIRAKLEEGGLRSKYELGLGALDLKMREMAQELGISQDELKTVLARDVMKLNTMVDLSNADHAHADVQAGQDRVHDMAMKPPTEPEGRAQAGHAYEQ